MKIGKYLFFCFCNLDSAELLNIVFVYSAGKLIWIKAWKRRRNFEKFEMLFCWFWVNFVEVFYWICDLNKGKLEVSWFFNCFWCRRPCIYIIWCHKERVRGFLTLFSIRIRERSWKNRSVTTYARLPDRFKIFLINNLKVLT